MPFLYYRLGNVPRGMVTQEEISEIEQYFKAANLPASITTKEGLITNVKQYIGSHLKLLQSHEPLNAYEGYYHNLLALKDILSGKI